MSLDGIPQCLGYHSELLRAVFVSLTCVGISGIAGNWILNWSFISSSHKSRTGEFSLLKGIDKFKVKVSKYSVILCANNVWHIS